MGLAIKFFCAILVIGFAGLFVLKKPDGTPWLSLDEFMPDTKGITSSTNDIVSKAKGMLDNDQPTTTANTSGGVYRWKDKNGQWQFSDQPPTANIAAEKIDVSGDLNRDIAEKFTPPETKPSATTASTANTPGTNVIPSTLSPEKVEKLMQDANNIQNLMDNRQKKLEKQLQ